MNILFITAHLYLPQMYGGLQQSANTLIKSLNQRGHRASILCALMANGLDGKIGRIKIKLSPHKVAKDTKYGYPIYRAWFPWDVVANVVKLEKPDVIVVLARFPVRMAKVAKATGVPVVMMFQDVEFDGHGGDIEDIMPITCTANSSFTAGKYHDIYGLNPQVIHPLIKPELYKTNTTREFITLINPNPLKGLDIALSLAKACPDIPFLFQESWPLYPEQVKELREKLAPYPNITFQRAMSDMRKVYGQTKILLVPSKWEEAYGRVASEVQMSGIPVIASARGGLPEAVGSGGILLDPDGDIQNWIDAVRKLWSDDIYYKEMSDAALIYANRPELNIEYQLDMWEKVLTKEVFGQR